MTARHAGLPVPSDVWLRDQLAGWTATFDRHAANLISNAAEGDSDMMVLARSAWIMDQQCELLLAARQLISEVLSRG